MTQKDWGPTRKVTYILPTEVVDLAAGAAQHDGLSLSEAVSNAIEGYVLGSIETADPNLKTRISITIPEKLLVKLGKLIKKQGITQVAAIAHSIKEMYK